MKPPTTPTPPAPIDWSSVRASFALRHLRAATLFMGKHDIRWYLNGIRIERMPEGGIIIIATDGHTLLALRDPEGQLLGGFAGINVRVDPRTIAAAGRVSGAKNCAKKHLMRAIVHGKRLSIAADWDSAETEMEFHIQPGNCQIDGWGIDWTRVMPSDFSALKPAVGSAFRATYMARMDTAIAALTGQGQYGGVRLWQASPDGAIIVQFLESAEALAIVMPVRDNATQPPLWKEIEAFRTTRNKPKA